MMAGNFSLTRKGESVPAKLMDVDAEFCAILGKPVDPVKWVSGWYGSIGMMLAFGRDIAYIREAVIGYPYEADLLLICDAIEANYSVSCWGS